MNLSKNQLNDLETLAYFNGVSPEYFSEHDIDIYLLWSEKGIGSGGNLSVMKQMRGVIMGEYEQGILEGSTPIFTLLGGFGGKRKWWICWKKEYRHKPIPRIAVEFMKKELFKGRISKEIEVVYQRLLKVTK